MAAIAAAWLCSTTPASALAAQSDGGAVPAVRAVTVDGRVEPAEWAGAGWLGTDDVRIGFGMDGDVLQVATLTPRLFVASLCVAVGDTVWVLHASSAVGHVRYERDGEDWRLLESFEWRLRGLDSGDAATRARQEHLEAFGWVANTVEVGAAGETEFAISAPRIPWRRARLALGVMLAGEEAPLGGWPVPAEQDGCTQRATIAGPPPPRATFSTDRWVEPVPAAGEAGRPAADAPPTSERVEIASGPWRLVGDMVLPADDGRQPAVLLLNQAAGDRSAHRHLARALAERGVASLRLDLRGHGESTNLGRFLPGALSRDPLIWDAEVDVAAALGYLRAHERLDAARVGVVGASYSGEEAAEAGRVGGYAALYALISPGSLGDASIDAMGASGVPWLLVTSEEDRFLLAITEAVHARAPGTDVLAVPGAGHGTDLLESHRSLPDRIAEWIAVRLR